MAQRSFHPQGRANPGAYLWTIGQDADRWEWENAHQPAGVSRSDSRTEPSPRDVDPGPAGAPAQGLCSHRTGVRQSHAIPTCSPPSPLWGPLTPQETWPRTVLWVPPGCAVSLTLRVPLTPKGPCRLFSKAPTPRCRGDPTQRSPIGKG